MATEYTPSPICSDHVVLDSDLLELAELLAENAHDVWAKQRMKDGWRFGPERSDTLKEHPCLVPYPELSEMEKEYDRIVAQGTIKAVIALGFEVSKM